MRISDWSSDVCSSDLTALVIDAKTLRFYESAGDLARVRDRSAHRIVADFRFSGEGESWDRLMLLGLADGGKTLVRRYYGEGAGGEPMRYTRSEERRVGKETGSTVRSRWWRRTKQKNII